MMMMGKKHRLKMLILMIFLMVLMMIVFSNFIRFNMHLIWVMFAAMASFMLIPVLMRRRMRRKFPAVDEIEMRLKCNTCGNTKNIPHHCGKPMHLENIEGKNMLVCWMGPECGKKDLPSCNKCSKPMNVV